jgi:hypothetical protein
MVKVDGVGFAMRHKGVELAARQFSRVEVARFVLAIAKRGQRDEDTSLEVLYSV